MTPEQYEKQVRKRVGWWYARGRHRARITGPKADENIVQALARDTVFATVMIVCNGVLGLCLFAGSLRHHVVSFRAEGTVSVSGDRLELLADHWSAARVDDAQTAATIATEFERSGMLLDPHTAVGLAAARQARADASVPMVVLSTAHPAKFPDAVEAASGVRPPLPEHLADLFDRPEQFEVCANDFATVRGRIEAILDQS